MNFYEQYGLAIEGTYSFMTYEKNEEGSKGKLNPKGNITRAELCEMIYRMKEAK